MPEWSADGIILSVRPYGENKAVVNCLTDTQGRHAGLVHGYDSRAKRGVCEPGNTVCLNWRARLSEQLGSFQIELRKNPSSLFLDNPVRLAGLSSVCAILEAGLPEREPVPLIWQSTVALLEIIGLAETNTDWLAFYVRWEADLLATLGFGLGLSFCAVSGRSDNLIYVSPKSGNAIHSTHAGDFADRMLALPSFLRAQGAVKQGTVTNSELVKGLTLTGHFIARRIFSLLDRDLPPARLRLAYLVEKNNLAP